MIIFPSMATRDRVTFLVVVAATLAAGCSQKTGFTATDASRLGDGIPSDSIARGELQFGGDDGCSPDTTVTLADQPGAPPGQQVCGMVSATATGAPLYLYRGIPYAADTGDANRWRDPQPPQFQQVRAVEYGYICPQGKYTEFDPQQQSEDCLYVNVWTPAITPAGSGTRPVMVFIHGGAFISGSGGSAQGDAPGHLNLYDGTAFVNRARDMGQEVVFVTMNYRLGALGFLAGDTIGVDGNFGIKDQTAALEWVQRNISRFGGDPSKVMIFGESAGAQSVALHLTITAGGHQGLFRSGVMESDYAVSYQELPGAQKKANAFAKSESCPTGAAALDCLKGKTIPEILQFQSKDVSDVDVACAGIQAILPWNPVVDRKFIEKEPLQGSFTKPVMNGSNLTESIPFLALLPTDPVKLDAIYVGLVTFLFGLERGAEILAMYDVAHPFMTRLGRFEQLVTDYMWTCFNRDLSRVAQRDAPGGNVWRYHDVHHGSFTIWTGPPAIAQACGTSPAVCHADELPFVFGNATNEQYVRQSFTPDEQSMVDALQRYWIQFAAGSNPNGASAIPEWKTNGSSHYLMIEAPASALQSMPGGDIATPAMCDYWDVVGYQVRSSFDCVE
jgi:para-nitrobenzyl esterase